MGLRNRFFTNSTGGLLERGTQVIMAPNLLELKKPSDNALRHMSLCGDRSWAQRFLLFPDTLIVSIQSIGLNYIYQ